MLFDYMYKLNLRTGQSPISSDNWCSTELGFSLVSMVQSTYQKIRKFLKNLHFIKTGTFHNPKPSIVCTVTIADWSGYICTAHIYTVNTC